MQYFHLTIPQQNIWNLQKYYKDTAISNICGAIFYRENRDSDLLKKAIELFVRNQSGIRLQFCEKEEPVQYVCSEIAEPIPVLDFTSMKEFDDYAQRFAGEPLGLTDRVMYRFVIFQIEEKSGVLVKVSHLVADAWTFGIMANQWEETYCRLKAGEEPPLLQADYRDFIQTEQLYFASERYQKDRVYWEEKYAVCPEESPIKLCSASNAAISAKRITKKLSSSLEQKIETFCRKHSVTPAVLFETALILYLFRINPENRSVTIGVPMLNRSGAKEKKIAGMFISTMPLTIQVEKERSVTELAKRIAGEHRELFRHQKYPYTDILKMLREKRNFSGNLYDVMISYQNAKTETGADTKWYSNGYSEIPLAVHIDNRDGNACHTINADYQTAVFEQEEMEYLINRLEYVLEQTAEDGERRIQDIGVVPKAEWKKITEEFNDTAADYPRDKCVHELFGEQAERTPDRVALVFENQKFTYRQLDEMSNALACFLREKGIGRGDVVPIASRRSWHIVTAMLGVLKAGAAYMPVAPDYPTDRIRYMLETAGSRLVLQYGCEGLEETVNGVVCMDLAEFDFTKGTAAVSATDKNRPEDPCYIIFTSGSTGTPKGVTICHKNVSNYCSCNNNVCFRIVRQECQSIVSVTNFIFDIFVTETFLPLLNGLTIYFANGEEVMQQDALAGLVRRNGIEIIQTTPARMRSFMLNRGNREYLSCFKVIVLGGETFPLDLYGELRQCTDAHIFNNYGPSETTVCSTSAEAVNIDITIGSPIANTQFYILDSDFRQVPIGVPGELCIAGDGVGLGYLNRPELTKERFITNPFATAENGHGRIMYRTGDLACWRTDGEVEFLGRMDTQVKIRGLRIELGEIESAMNDFPGLQLSVAADKRDENGRQYLVGYYTSETELNERKLRKHLSARLPKYMVPNYFLRLSSMPMTPSGKTDRKSLPTPDFAVNEETYAAPETETEEKLAEIWKGLLKLSKVGRTDDFFELGGDSLLAISMVSGIAEQFQTEVSIKDILENPSLEQLAECVEQSSCPTVRIEPHHEKRYPLLPQQKAIYAACRKEPEALTYHMPARIVLPEEIDREKLKKSICQVLECRRILKSHIEADAEEIYGVYDEDAEICFEEYGKGEEDNFLRTFHLEKAPLVHIGFTEDSLLFDMHHIIADGDSLNLILQDMVNAYEGRDLQKEATEYSDYAEYFHRLDLEEHRAFYREMLKCDFEKAEFPKTRHPRKGGKSSCYRISEELFSKVKKFGRENGLTDTAVFLGAYGILLSRYTGRKDVLGGVILRNRTHAEMQDMVGMFVNTLPVHFGVEGAVKEYFQDIKQMLMKLFRYQELPFWEIADAVGMKDRTVLNTSFVYQADGEKKLILDGKELELQFLDTHSAKFDFSMEITPLEKGGRMRLEYDLTKYDEALMDELAAAYLRILEQLDQENVKDISVLSEETVRRITEEFNDTAVDYPRDKCVHELFREQAERTPDQAALVFEEQTFTYRQMDDMSDALACFLRKEGIGRGDVVPIAARRSWHIVAGMLGVLKAGAAYMPVAPDYPADRIRYMLETAGSRLVLKYGCEGLEEAGNGASCVDLAEFDFSKGTAETSAADKSRPEDPCYIIFTSGSTGMPKGVTICHKNVSNYCSCNNNNNVCFHIVKQEYQSIVSVTNFIFDIFVTETFLPLLNGLTVYFANDDEVMRQDALAGLVRRNGIEIIQTTPTRMRSFMLNRGKREYLGCFKAIVLGGEAFPPDLYGELRQCTDARIFNIYGPAETTVWSSNAEVMNEDITIGKPIANTQIYILDGDLGQVPVGVPGELCIAGDGVGLGYLNRPELTAERFVQNPFATEENGHGRILYRTGDLASWRADGEIMYLGRMDTQVKIRGLRIELGEIESAMAGFSGIQLVAVADKKDENGRQYLVGYYTSKTELDEKKLRGHLSARLPNYMVPNYFLRLSDMPMTPSGKTDRKNLPVPDVTALEDAYVPPRTPREKILCGLAADLLGVERFGIEDNFFENGGDSLTAIEYMAKAHEEGIRFSLQDVFDCPTVCQLCAYLDAGDACRVHYATSDFEKYRALLAVNKVDVSFALMERDLGDVLLTGATGFLGAQVLDSLMSERTGRIYCLMRGSKEEACIRRLGGILQYYFGSRYDAELGNRILAVVGDIESDGLGEILQKRIPGGVRTVIHTAASVKHYGSYAYFHQVNCEGTRQIAEYAKAVGARLMHVSTLSVSGNSVADDFAGYRSREEKKFYETSLYIGQPLDNVYTRSKFEAECAVYNAILEGLDAKVVRVGNLTNRLSDFRFQPNYRENAFLTRMKALLELGIFPDYLMPLYCEFSPVDETAKGIVALAKHAGRQNVFHLYNNRPIYFDRLLEVLHELGISMKVVDGTEFHRVLQGTLRGRETAYIYEAFQNDMDEQGKLAYDSNIHIESEFSLWFLQKAGFCWKETDAAYIRGYIEYFRRIGYLNIQEEYVV